MVQAWNPSTGDGEVGDQRSRACWVVAHVFNPSTWDAEAGRVCEVKISLIYA